MLAGKEEGSPEGTVHGTTGAPGVKCRQACVATGKRAVLARVPGGVRNSRCEGKGGSGKTRYVSNGPR